MDQTSPDFRLVQEIVEKWKENGRQCQQSEWDFLSDRFGHDLKYSSDECKERYLYLLRDYVEKKDQKDPDGVDSILSSIIEEKKYKCLPIPLSLANQTLVQDHLSKEAQEESKKHPIDPETKRELEQKCSSVAKIIKAPMFKYFHTVDLSQLLPAETWSDVVTERQKLDTFITNLDLK